MNVHKDEYVKICQEVNWVEPFFDYDDGQAKRALEDAIEESRTGASIPQELYEAAEREFDELAEPVYDLDMARYAADQCCRDMASAIAKIEGPAYYDPQLRKWYVDWPIAFCPWCGTELPSELECEWVDEHQRRGLPPGGSTDDEDLPEDMKDDRWWKAAGP